MPPKKILIGVDGSPSATRAMNDALNLAEKLQSKVLFVYVIHLPLPAYNFRIPEQASDRIRDEGNES
jgi:nucleotide-binding universal stress UspA family protein